MVTGLRFRNAAGLVLLGVFLAGAVAAAPDDEAVKVYCGRCRVALGAGQWAASQCSACLVAWNGETSHRQTTTTVTKRCSACGKVVPDSSRPGQHCPHCGVYWSREDGSSAGDAEDEVDITHRVLIKAHTITSHGTTLVPLRALRPLGVDLGWDEAKRVATVVLGERTVTVPVGATQGSLKSGSTTSTVSWSLAPRQEGDAVYVPLRGVCEALHLVVDYDGGTILLGSKCALRPLD